MIRFHLYLLFNQNSAIIFCDETTLFDRLILNVDTMMTIEIKTLFMGESSKFPKS